MPTDQETIAELRKTVARQQLLISQQRAANNRARVTRIRMVAGQHVDQVDPQAEASKISELMQTADTDFAELLKVLGFYAKAENYEFGGAPSIASPVMQDKGARMRAALRRFA